MRTGVLISSVQGFFRPNRPFLGARAVSQIGMATPSKRARRFSSARNGGMAEYALLQTNDAMAAAFSHADVEASMRHLEHAPATSPLLRVPLPGIANPQARQQCRVLLPSLWRVSRSDTAATRVLSLTAPWLVLLEHAKVFPFVARRTVCVENVPLVVNAEVDEKKKQIKSKSKTLSPLLEHDTGAQEPPPSETVESTAARPASCGRQVAFPASVAPPGARRAYCSGGAALAQQLPDTLEGLEKTTPNWTTVSSFVPDNLRDMMTSQLKKTITKTINEKARLKECFDMKDTPEMRQRMRETLHQALEQFGPIKKISVFETHKSSTVPTSLVQSQSSALGLGFVEFTRSASLGAVLSPECQLFGIVWPSLPKPTGHMVYSFPLQACRSLIVKWRSPSTKGKRESAHRAEAQNKGKKRNRMKRDTPIISDNPQPKEALAVILETLYQAASRFSRTRLKTAYLARRIGVKIRHCPASDRGHGVVAHSLSIRKVKLRVPCQSGRETALHTSRRALPRTRKNSCPASYAETSRAGLQNEEPARGAAALDSSRSEGSSAGHEGVWSSLSTTAVRGGGLQRRLPSFSSMSAMAESLLEDQRDMKSGSLEKKGHPHQLILTFASFRIAYAAFVILSQSSVLKDFEVTFFSQMPVV